eukprot:CAMPEP_0117025770 /NCGR_PEP_ID=MMETSP0472-20121206/19007_1 /TAXON_ID=693140 ORGANISM="Tiarina fusus, Strain LIS" /NCGR_SAMPLE_ID=MMETSP0472 /ASSEMBLY_ACC=CAM_ASM_000603 /LENGTH=877 /DNA_ID=CAMNT_0004732585 /DNA_START=316 /DNA_END=2949 /DNA_ORIENTATION=-
MAATSPILYSTNQPSTGDSEGYHHHEGASAASPHRLPLPTGATPATSPTDIGGATMTETATDGKKRAASPSDGTEDSSAKRLRIDESQESAYGFVPKKVNNEQWDTMFDLLVLYKQQHGDCLVPKRYAQDPKLGTWVETQRVQYKRLPRTIDQESGSEMVQPNKRLTGDRLNKLESIGFAWSAKHVRKKKADSPQIVEEMATPSARRQRLNEAQWEDMFQRLAKFRNDHGHCLVPRKHEADPKLATWVETQRALWNRDYRNKGPGSADESAADPVKTDDLSKKRLTPTRKWKLDQLGFVWSLRSKRIEDHWDEMFQQLLEYKRLHGDCLVPSRYEANLKLGKWVETQRYEYTKLQRAFGEASAISPADIAVTADTTEEHNDAKPSANAAVAPRPTNPRLTEARLERLESIGFEWKVKHKMKRYYDKQWDHMFGRLMAFKEANGHCMVPKRYPPDMKLGTWVHTQRIQYRKLVAGVRKEALTEEEVSELKSYGEEVTYRLTEERRARLARAGFVWSAREGEKGTEATGGVGRITRNSYDDQWDSMFRQLKSYKEKYGDCLVPKRYKENPKLGTWVDTQRVQFKKLKKKLASQGKNVEEGMSGNEDDQSFVENLDSAPAVAAAAAAAASSVTNQGALTMSPKPLVGRLTDDRIRRLHYLGFVWSLRDDWQKHYDELKAYKKEHGHCNVPARYAKNRRLGIWVSAQRQHFKIMNQMPDSAKQRRSAPLTSERIGLLNELGFTWTIRSRDSLGESWNQRLEDLKEFKAQHGHCLVPSRYPSNPELGIWVGTQRTQYRLYMKSKETGTPPSGSTAMNDERIRELEELGFVWALRNTKEETASMAAVAAVAPVEDEAVAEAAGAAAAAVEAADQVMEHYVAQI